MILPGYRIHFIVSRMGSICFPYGKQIELNRELIVSRMGNDKSIIVNL